VIKILLFLWFLNYTTGIIKTALKKHQHTKCIKYLAGFIAIYGYQLDHYYNDPEEYREEINDLLRNAPLISELVPYPKLSYSHTDQKTFEISLQLLNDLNMQHNEVRIELRRSFIPFTAAKEIILLPVEILKTLGFNLNKTAAFLLTLFPYVFNYLAEMFKPEIKQLILLLLEQFV